MTQDDIIRMAREAGIIDFRDAEDDPHVAQMVEFLESFSNLATAKERESRQAAQIENEELKSRLARADLEQHRAVLAEIEACARYFEYHWRDRWTEKQIVDAIRARKDNT